MAARGLLPHPPGELAVMSLAARIRMARRTGTPILPFYSAGKA